MNTLDHLEEMGIPVVCDRWLTLPANPDLVNVDALYSPLTSHSSSSVPGSKSAANLDPSLLLSNVSANNKQQLPEKGIILR